MKISDAAQQAGVLATTIRYYESIGLLPPAHRINGHRVYGSEILDRLAVIRFGLQTGFSLAELKELFLDLGSRTQRRSAAQKKLKELRNLSERVELMQKLLKEIRLCRCGTIRQIADRLIKAGALAGGDFGPADMTVRRRVAKRSSTSANLSYEVGTDRGFERTREGGPK